MSLFPTVLWLFLLLALAGCVPTRTHILRAPYWNEPLAVTHHFVPLEEGRLYSSAMPNTAFLNWLVREKGVRVLVSLRGPLPPEIRALAAREKLAIYTFAWSATRVPPEEELRAVFTLMKNASGEYPVLVFCKAGVDRTGYARAYYRYYAQGWSARDALREFSGLFHLPNVLDDDLKRKFDDPTYHPSFTPKDR